MGYYGVDPVKFVGVSHVTDALGANHPEVGTRTVYDGEEYVWAYNDGNSQISPSYGATILANSGVSVSISSTSSDDMFVGVCKHATITTGAYGWLLTKGFCNVEMEADTSAVTGALLVPAADGEFADKSASTGIPAQIAGKLVESVASGASGKAYISV